MSGQAGETEEYKRLLEFKDILLDSKERLFQVGLSIDSLLRRYNECRLPSTWSLCRLGALIAGVGRMEMLLAGFHQSLRKAEIGEAPLLEENEAVTEVVTSVAKFMRRGLCNFIGGRFMKERT